MLNQSISLIKFPSDFEIATLDTEIYKDYSFNCNKGWSEDQNGFEIYAIINGIPERVFIDIRNHEKNKSDAISLISPLLTNKCLIAGCHTAVNLKDRFKIGHQPLSSLELCMDILISLKRDQGISADFTIPLNDFFMDKDAGNSEGEANKFREAAIKPYIAPPIVRDIIYKAFNAADRDDVNDAIGYFTEKNLADRFGKKIKTMKKKDSSRFRASSNGKDWFVKLSKTCGDWVQVISDNKPNCVAGNAATFDAISCERLPNKVKLAYTSHVGVYPRCSMDNVLNGARVWHEIYDKTEDLKIFLIFTDVSCN